MFMALCLCRITITRNPSTTLLIYQSNSKSLYCFSEHASTSNGGALENSANSVPPKVEKDSSKELALPTVTNDIDLGAEFVVPFSFCSRSLALSLLFSWS